MSAAPGLLYATSRPPLPSGAADLDLRGAPVDRAVAEALRWLRTRGWSGEVRVAFDPKDPGSRAVAGLMRVAEAEEGPLLRVVLEPAIRLARVPEPLTPAPPARADLPTGPWSARVLRALGASRVRLDPGAALVGAVEPPADAPIRALDPARTGAAVAAALASLGPGRQLWVTTADDVVGRPFSAASAAHSGAVGAWAEARGVPVLALGPTADAPGARHHGVAPLAGAAIGEALAAALATRGSLVALDVEWGAALAAFPHLRPVAGHLAAAPTVRRVEVVDAVRDELGRILGVPRPSTTVAVRELGLDSVGGSQLRVELERRFAVALPATLVFDHPTPEAIADRVLAELSASRPGSRR